MGSTVALPKATVQLQPPSQPLGAPTPTFSTSTIHTADDDDVADGGEGLAKVLAIVGFLAAAAVLVIQFLTFKVWGTEGIGQLFE